MPIPDEFTLEQRTVMIIAIEEGYLNEVIVAYGARLRWAETGSTLNPSILDHRQIRALIPHFVAVVTDMIERDLIEIREPASGIWDDAQPFTRPEVDAVLADHATWFWGEPDDNRMVMLMTTGRADLVLGRRTTEDKS